MPRTKARLDVILKSRATIFMRSARYLVGRISRSDEAEYDEPDCLTFQFYTANKRLFTHYVHGRQLSRREYQGSIVCKLKPCLRSLEALAQQELLCESRNACCLSIRPISPADKHHTSVMIEMNKRLIRFRRHSSRITKHCLGIRDAEAQPRK